MKMKGVVMFLHLCLIASGLSAQGIFFESMSYAEALTKAKAENKLIFVDCYASWCAPCKRMAEDVFQQKKVGSYFNTRFINLKCDIEKEGKELADQFGVQVVPTFLLITPEGKLQHRISGAFAADVFLEKISRGADSLTSLRYLEEVYHGGKMNVIQLRDYVITLLDAAKAEQAQNLCEKLLSKLPETEKVKVDCWQIYTHPKLSPIFSPNFNYLLRNKAKFEEHVGRQKVEAHLVGLCQNYLDHNLWEQKQNPDRNYNKQELLLLDSVICSLSADVRKMVSLQRDLYVAMIEKDIPVMLDGFTTLASLSPQDKLYGYVCTSEIIADIGTKADMKRLVEVIERYESMALDEQLKTYIHLFNEGIRKRAADGVYFDDMPLTRVVEYGKVFKRPFFLYFYIPGNKACEYLDENVFTRDTIGNLLKQGESLRIDITTSEGKKIMARFGIRGVPTCVLIDPDGKVRWKIIGKPAPERFLTGIREALK